MNSPLVAEQATVNVIMLKVLAALLPAIAVYVFFFGPAILVSILLASVAALLTEAAVLHLRRYPLRVYLLDGSALVTAWLLALSIPPLAPWWLVVVGTVFAILVAKHLYGGLGNNLFNPAMVGFAALMISFPSHMTHWPAPDMLAQSHWSFTQQMDFMFGGEFPAGDRLDAITMATPLDTLKTQLHLDREISEIQSGKIFSILSGKGTEIIALFYLLGGLFLWQQRIISWHIPASFLAAMFGTAGLFYLFDPGHYASPMFHLFAGGTMLGAFFIATDYVTSPTTPMGKLIFGAGIGVSAYVIRVLGGYPDGVAFAVLFLNSAVPLIDAYTQPRVFGHAGKWFKGGKE
ncbi:MAG: RnfABCDGE type electron transport complex subunit D [Sulfuricella denitrificans]|nr:RnfABCDGE type electron transport complex subunit D [Sulfuricella denitrificans]